MSWALHTAVHFEAASVHLQALEAAGLLGMSERDGVAVLWFPARVEGLPLPGEWEEVADRDWNAEARRLLTPVLVGDIVVAPPWAEQVPTARLRVDIDPGQAFGTGHHESTTGCLAVLQELDLRGRAVLDVGCGSGVLAIAAALLGGDPVVAVDIDPLAVAASRENAARNRVRVDVREGSAADVAERFGVVVANLDTATITAVAPHLAARLAPGGTLVASGVSVGRLDEGVAALEAAGLAVWARPGREWAVLSARLA